MKLKLDDVRSAFSVVDHVVANSVMESSKFVRVRTAGKRLLLTMTGTLWAEGSADGDDGGKWQAWVDRRALGAFLSSASKPELEIVNDKGKLVLKCGQRLEVVPHEPIIGYESRTLADAFTLPAEQKLLLAVATKFLPTVPGTEYVDALCFATGYGMISSDTNFMMALLGTKVHTDFFLPASVAEVLGASAGEAVVDATGVGGLLGAGSVYQPLSAELDKYPVDACKGVITKMLKAKATAVFHAGELADVLSKAAMFLFDKYDSGQISACKSGALVTVNTQVGQFQRVVRTAETCTIPAAANWPVKRLMPWIQYAAALGEGRIEYASNIVRSADGETSGSHALRFVHEKRQNLLVFADV